MLAVATHLLLLLLQTVLDDSAQIRTTLQGFTSVLQEMSQVCDIATLQEQLLEADRQVADVQDSFTAPLSQLEHAAAVRLNYIFFKANVVCGGQNEYGFEPLGGGGH